MIIDRLKIYEQRTGDLFALNVVAKLTEMAGVVSLAVGMHENWTPREGIASAGLIIGGMALDKATGGLRPYPRINRGLKDQSSSDKM